MVSNAEVEDGSLVSDGTIRKLKRHSVLSIMTFLVGVALVVIVGYVEDDPIIPPFLMIVFGAGWFIVTRIRIRSLRKAHQ